MTNAELIESLQILTKGHESKLHDIWAEHEEMGVGARKLGDFTPEEVKRLRELDWFIDTDYCENPVEETKENNYDNHCYQCDSCKESYFKHYV